jgi:hypothetical protein
MLRELRDQYINPKHILKRTSRQFVLDYGWFYTPMPLHTGVKLSKKAECYNNALNLTLDDPTLVYVEGFAIGKAGVPVSHAWATDGKGHAIDNTWASPSLFVNLTGVKNKSVGSLIDDWDHDWPLLHDLGDHPEHWLQLMGKGFTKLS